MNRPYLAALAFSLCLPAQTVVTLSTAGAGTWVAPAGVTSIKVECWGGGGSGGTMTTNGGGGGGGGGAYAARLTMAVTPGVIYNYTVGAAGTAGGNGGTTTFTGDTSVQCVAAGGSGVANNIGTGGAGGLVASSTGDSSHVFAGGAGANGFSGSYGGGGGASGGSAATGTTATVAAGATAVTGGGPGGNGKSSPQGNGSSPANGPGGGGGGGLRTSSGTRTGANGWAGQIVITYNTMTTAVNDSLYQPVASVVADSSNVQTRSVSDTILFAPSQQARWGNSISGSTGIKDIAGLGRSASVSDNIARSETVDWLRPAANWAATVIERIPYSPSEQSRWGLVQSLPVLAKDTSSGVQAAFFHAYASVVENIPYVPATKFSWAANPQSESTPAADLTSQAYTPNSGGDPVVHILRRAVMVK